jgi:beta-barrel assembly-enhancing protease
MPYRQVADSLEFHLVRAKLRVEQDVPRDALAFFEIGLKDRKFLSEAAARYGLVASLLRIRDFSRARIELPALRKTRHPMIEHLACRVHVAADEPRQALACFEQARKLYPEQRALLLGHVEELLRARQPAEALQLIEPRLRSGDPDEVRLYRLQAQAYAVLDNPLLHHRALGEAYARSGALGAAVQQFEIAIKTGKGDFFQLSAVEARLRELRRQQLEQDRKK